MASLNLTTTDIQNFQVDESSLEKLFASPYQVLGWIFIFFNTMLSNSAGIGGGPITVSILLYLFQLSGNDALALSQISIIGGSVIAMIIKMRFKHPIYTKYPLIDYKLCALMAPTLMLGASYGSLFTKMFPSWFLLSLLSLLVWVIIGVTLNKGLNLYKLETEKKKGYQPIPNPIKNNEKEPKGLSSAYLGIFFSVLMLVLYSCSKIFFKYFHFWENCVFELLVLSGIYHLMTIFQIIWYCGVLTKETLENQELEEIYSNRGNIVKLSLLSYITGVVSGTLGIGGGLVLNPMLVVLGMNIEVSTACCNLMVFSSSISSSLQFIIAGSINWPEGLLLFTLSILGSGSGIFYIKKKIEDYGRVSLIVLLLAGVLSIVGVLIPIQLIRLTDTLISEGQFSFSLEKVC
jgi:uncharacterized membrane protein YfcA